jgi:hypothetical protein
VLSKSGPGQTKAVSETGNACSDEEVGQFTNTALYPALLGKSPPTAFVGETGENQLPTASFVDSGSIFHTAQLRVHARALGKVGVAACGDRAAVPRWRQSSTAVSSISDLECAVAGIWKLAYIQESASMCIDRPL